MFTRRQWLGRTLGAGAALALNPQWLQALQQGQLLTRAVPSTGEQLPLVGLGSSATFSQVARSEDYSALREVLRTLVERGGKVFVDSTRVGAATVVAAYSPRVRPGVPVSFPVRWDDLDQLTPADFTIHTALAQLGHGDPWADQMPAPQSISTELVEEGGAIPVGRVQAMHEGKRRARAKRAAD